jgi:hypothetical protein
MYTCTATGYGPDDRGVGVRVPVGSRIFISLCRPDRLRGPPSLLSDVSEGSKWRQRFPPTSPKNSRLTVSELSDPSAWNWNEIPTWSYFGLEPLNSISFHTSPTACLPKGFLSNGYRKGRALAPGIKRLEPEADHSHPPIVQDDEKKCTRMCINKKHHFIWRCIWP